MHPTGLKGNIFLPAHENGTYVEVLIDKQCIKITIKNSGYFKVIRLDGFGTTMKKMAYGCLTAVGKKAAERRDVTFVFTSYHMQ